MANPEVSSTGLTGHRDTERGHTGKYAVLMELGSGGSATVSAAVSTGIAGFSKVVVLKTIRDGLGRDENTIKMFLVEARLSARMNHPNVVQVYEVFKQNNLPVIVMEYVDGQSLGALLATCGANADFPREIGIAILAKTLAGLHYAHTLVDYSGEPLHLVHRDVSPQNVMIGYDGQVKLVDFGIAKLKNQSVQTRDGVLKGKLCYMAPEQIQNQADHRADIFAVGVMLWEILARRRLWGDSGDAAIITRLLTEDIPRLRDFVPDVDPELERICSKALAPDPERRYESALDMQNDLEAYLKRSSADVSQQAIGTLLERACRTQREQTRVALQEKMKAMSVSLTEDVDLSDGNDIGAAKSLAGRAGGLWLVGLAGVAALALAGVLVFQRTPPPAAVAAPPPAHVSAPALAQVPLPEPSPSAAPAPPERVTVNVSVTPQEARLYLDERLLASNPFRDTLPRDSLEHTFRARAEGYEEFEKIIRLESDLDITVSMKAEKPTAKARPFAVSRPRTKPLASPAREGSPSAAGEAAAPSPETKDAPREPAPPRALAPGEDLRAARGAERRGVQFEDPFTKK